MRPPNYGHLPPSRLEGARAQVPLQQACLLWLGAWMVGQLLAAAVLAATGSTNSADAGPGWLVVVAVAGWVPLLAAMWSAGRRWGVGSFEQDWGLSFRAADLWGIPIGIVTQLVLLPLLYWPLRAIWPDTFSQARIEERARDLYESASGAGLVLLVAVVALGAPVVEELVYRGLLQGAFTRRLHEGLGVVIVALWFAVIHFQPIETPGLFLVGLVFGTCALVSRRLGLGIVAHVAFNATGLALVAWA